MKLSQLYMPTLREVPADTEIASHQLMLRAAMMRQTASGIYAYLPLGLRVIKKIEKVVREEMDNIGSQEILMSAIQPKELWQASGRWEDFGPEMFKFKDRHSREFCLGPTAEEYFTNLIKGEVNSYKQLPLSIYQISNKYRDEKRPRFGLNRAREFSMKDAYTFDTSEETMMVAYRKMHEAYLRVFDRLDLDYRIVQGSSGAMGGDNSHEYIALADTGEGVIVYTADGSYAATDEKAAVNYELPAREAPESMEKVRTPGTSTIEAVSNFLKVDPARCAKAIDLIVEGQPVFVFIPGDRELNMTKLVTYLGVPEHDILMMSDDDIVKYGSSPGFTGPVDLWKNEDVRVILDKRLTQMNNLVVGANQADYHYKNANFETDFEGEVAEDLLMVKEGDKTADGKDLIFARGIEVGNIFQLGTKYSEALDAKYLDENGREQVFWMGSYGIGITRTVTAIIDQNYDENGIIWPISSAPYEAIVTIINTKKEDQMALGQEIYDALQREGIEVLLDDRKERAGVKFNDRDLIGIPLRITVGKGAPEGIVEYSRRDEGVNYDMPVVKAIETLIDTVKENRA